MTKKERIQAAVQRKAVDRPPLSFWRHFPDLDKDPFALAEALLAFHTRYDLDFIKVMPTGSIVWRPGAAGWRTRAASMAPGSASITR